MKRVFTFLLCLCLVFVMVPVTGAASSGSVSLSDGTFYSTVEDALDAAESGTVMLQRNMVAGKIIIPEDVTLDLNGYTLVADIVVVIDGAVIDSESTGKLIVGKNALRIFGDNGGKLPVWDENKECYKFTSIVFQQMLHVANDQSFAHYIFLPNFDLATTNLLRNGGADNGISVKVLLTWNQGASQQTYTFSDAIVAQVYGSADANGICFQVFQLTITGIAGIEDMTACAVVESVTNSAIADVEKVVTQPKDDSDTSIIIPDIDNYQTPNFNGKTLDLYMPASIEFDAEGCYADRAISKTLNVNLVIHELNSFNSQYNPMLAEGDIPSLTMRNSWTNANNQLGEDGAMINIYDYLDAMPHVKWYLENTEEGKQFVKNYSYKEGVLYAVPFIESGTAECYGYLYRKDVFAKNNMEFPTTEEEFYNTLIKLKSLYPNSYPFVMRGMSGNMGNISAWGYTWGIGHQIFGVKNSVFTLQNGEYVYAPTTDIYKEMLQYIEKLFSEGLMHPSSMTMDTSGWTEAFASDKSFVSFDKMDRLPSLNLAGQWLNPDFKIIGATGIPFGEHGRMETQYMGDVNRYYMIGYNDQLSTTLQYVDWLYSKQGIEVTNWGIEGESFRVNENGENELIMDFVNNEGSFNATGFGMAGVAGYKDFNSYLSACDEDMRNSVATCLAKATADEQILLTYTGADQLVIDTYATSCQSYASMQMAKFIMGQRDFSEWDAYVNELKTKYHLDELRKAHENAYQLAQEK